MVVAPGILALSGAEHPRVDFLQDLSTLFGEEHPALRYPLWVVVDDAEFAAGDWANFLWITFTRSDPAADTYGVGSFTRNKHWGCSGPLVIDARTKPHHAPGLEEDPDLVKKVEALAVKGSSLSGIF